MSADLLIRRQEPVVDVSKGIAVTPDPDGLPQEIPNEGSPVKVLMKIILALVLAIFLVLGGLTMYVYEDEDDVTENTPRKTTGTSSKVPQTPSDLTTSSPANVSQRAAYEADGICHEVVLMDCNKASHDVWYPAGADCYQWRPETQCANSVDSFRTDGDCLSACLDGWCSTVERWTDLRRCLTADKLHPWFYADGRCHRLNDSELVCLEGTNRFTDEEQCRDACLRGPGEKICTNLVQMSQKACAEEKAFPYIFYPNSRTCAPISICANTSFTSYEDCKRRCFP
ncbi:papilin-like isoform X2 [Ornithodoros turicata]|uniref:papilin-like isoform X2 n=1 Tax=Ornithodoros turicata TaxID=34597 RepID=UPI0031396948